MELRVFQLLAEIGRTKLNCGFRAMSPLSTPSFLPMKSKNLIIAAAFILGATATAQAQVTPTTPQRGGIRNQTTVPAASPSNPGTIDQRTPTTTNPTQTSTGSPTQIGTSTIDQQPAIQRPTVVEPQRIDQRTGTTTQPATTIPSMNTDVNQRREVSPKRRATETAPPRP